MTWQLDNKAEEEFDRKVLAYTKKDPGFQVEIISTVLEYLAELNDNVSLTRLQRNRFDIMLNMLRTTITTAE